MSKNLTLARAKNILKILPKSESFWLCTNQDLRSLNTLAKSLDQANDDVFRYHVNKYKNDFSTWVKDIIGDNDFAREISRIKTKATLVRKIDEKINESRALVRKYNSIAKKRKKTFKKRAVKRVKPKKVKKKVTRRVKKKIKRKKARKKVTRKKKKPLRSVKIRKKVAKRKPARKRKHVVTSKKKITKKSRRKKR